MALTADEFYANALQSADADGRMQLSRMTAWDIFPFEPDGLRVVPLAKPELPESPRRGEHGNSCDACSSPSRGDIWSDDHWRLVTFSQPSGAPLVIMLMPKRHFDLTDLPDDLAAQMGRLIVHTARAIEELEHIARAHVSRWGDGGAHLHIFFFARPEGFEQLKGTCLAIWDDLLAPTPLDVRNHDALAVARALEQSLGGTASTK